MSVRLRKSKGETTIPRFILTFRYVIYACVKSGVKYGRCYLPLPLGVVDRGSNNDVPE